MHDIKFSIITIVLNGVSVIEKTLTSVINQKNCIKEYILVDGGSTDGTLDILKNYSIVIDHLISGKDQGIYDAMNKGIDVHSGDYLIFMNSGDRFADNLVLQRIENQMAINNYPDFVYGDAFEYSPVTGKIYFKRARNHSTSWYGMFAHHQSMIYASKIIREDNLRFNLQYKVSADWAFTISFINKARSIVKVSFPVSIFEQGGFSSNFFPGLIEQYKIRRNLLKYPELFCYSIFALHWMFNMIRKHMPFIFRLVRLQTQLK